MNTIVNDINELRGIGYPVGTIDPSKFIVFAREAEMLYIKPMIGEALYLKLVNDPQAEEYETLLNGGAWTDEKGDQHHLTGLKTAFTYYLYAQSLMSCDIQQTRFGNVLKNNEYSSHITPEERTTAYNNALEIANTYMKEVVAYCRANGLITKSVQSRVNTAGAIRIRKIGK